MENQILKKGIIYIIQHNDNTNMTYVGQTIDTLNKRWSSHLGRFKQHDRMYYRLCFFVNYYGVENFSIREYKIYKNITQDYLDNEEKKYIYEFGTLNSRYSNENITIKITNEMRNSLLNKFINEYTSLTDLYKLIHAFKYDYNMDELDFTLDDINKDLLNKKLQSELSNKLINMEIRMTQDFYDKNGNRCCKCFRNTKPFMEKEMMLEDFLKYIEYFHEHFQITNNKDDIYYSNDLIFGLQEHGNKEGLFDFYFLQDFSDIMQKYFDILNETFKNVSIDVSKSMIYGVKKKVPISFKMIDEIEWIIRDYIQTVDSSKYDDFTDFVYTRKDRNLSKYDTEFDLYENKLDIEVLKDDIHTIWYALYRRYLKYDEDNPDYDGGDEYIIYDNMSYSYDYDNMDKYCENKCFLNILKYISDRSENVIQIIDDKHIIVTEY